LAPAVAKPDVDHACASELGCRQGACHRPQSARLIYGNGLQVTVLDFVGTELDNATDHGIGMVTAPVHDSDSAVFVSVSAAVMADRDRGGASKMLHAANSAGGQFPEITNVK
jgi:hypothetical protein